MKKQQKIFMLVLIIALASVAVYFFQRYLVSNDIQIKQNLETTITPAKRTKISALGRLEPKGELVDIGAPGIYFNTVLDRLLVYEGQEVKAGDTLAYLKTYAIRTAEKNQIKSELREAIATREAETAICEAEIAKVEVEIERIKEVYPLEIEEQQAKIRKLEIRFENQQKYLNRQEKLIRNKTISDQDVDNQSSITRQAGKELDYARTLLKKLTKEFIIDLKSANVRLKKAKATLLKAQVSARVESLEKKLITSEELVNLSIIKAPFAGRILKIKKYPGENVSSFPILQMGNVSQMYAVAQVYETDIRFVKIGQKAQIASPALPEKVSGIVDQIGNIIFKNDVLGDDPTAAIDARVVEVKICLDTNETIKRLSNLTIDVDIFLDE